VNRPVHTLVWTIAAMAMPLLGAGCATTNPPGPYSPMMEAGRDPAASQRLTREAAAVIATDPARAESLLRDALNADLYNGPAHNNLGALYLAQGKLYEAAGEFEWARKLMPGHPDPRLNLALTLEKAGRTDEALATYATALEVYPEHIPTMQALTRLQLRAGRADERTARFLDEISLRGETPAWRDWARFQRARLGP
jgi:Tfp pilus assembly protein PilF